jgi:hypothetical protein
MTSERFESVGCVMIPSFVDKDTIATFSKYLQNKANHSVFKAEGNDWNSDFYWYADPLTEILLENYLNKMEQVVGKKLLPTYSYSRIYTEKNELAPHTDRESCEVTVSINIATSGKESPIYLQDHSGKTHQYFLSPGDAVVYKGIEITHWRRPLKETGTKLNAQIMLHYVNKEGLYSNYFLDTRPSLGLSSSARRGI